VYLVLKENQVKRYHLAESESRQKWR